MIADVIPFPGSDRASWTGWDEYLFEHFRHDGLNVLEAVKKIEREIASRDFPYSGPERLLRQAREALASAKELHY